MNSNSKIIPGILTQRYDELHEQVEVLKGAVDWLQIDVMDGKFVDAVSTALIDIPDDEFSGFQVEAHLMVENPLPLFAECKRLGMRRVVVHYEAVQDELDDAIIAAHDIGLQVVVGLNPGTTVSHLESYGHLIDGVLVMSVTPGKQGQVFMAEVLPKISEIKLLHDSILIGIDGGINQETLPTVVKYNLDYVIVGSAISGAEEPLAALHAMQQQI